MSRKVMRGGFNETTKTSLGEYPMAGAGEMVDPAAVRGVSD